MKKIIYFFCLFCSCSCFSQKIRGFGGFGIFLNKGFEKSSFFSIDGGLELKINNVIKPEIEIDYFFGALQDKTKEDINGFETERLTRTISASTISVCSKILLGNEEDNVRFQILPKYSISKVFGNGSLFTFDTTKQTYRKTDSDKYSEISHALGIGIGILFDLSDDTFQSIAANLYYNNIDLGNVLTNLKFNTTNFHTQQSLGIGINYYFSFSKRKK